MSYKTYNQLGGSKTDSDVISVVELKTNEQKQQVITSNDVCVIDVYASWCGPCKTAAPIFAKMSLQYNSPGKCMLVKQNIENNLTNDTQILSVPIFLFYKKGELVHTINGADMQSIKNKIDQLLIN